MVRFKPMICLFCFAWLLLPSLSGQEKVSRVEPPSWWVGMKDPALQLLVYGDGIADLQPVIHYAGVRIEKVIKVPNPNYLFVDLHIDGQTAPGDVVIEFQKDGKVVESRNYPLQARRPGSAERAGFDQSDVLYLITPDRFANGDPTNDNVAGLLEKADRQNKDGRHGGDIKGMRDHLDYIIDLGFTAIWVNPLLENDQPEYSYHGYSTTDFYKVDPRFGTNEEYQELSKIAKEKGVKMIMDMIVNHCGSEHWWMGDLPTPDWINFPDSYVQTNHRKPTIQDPYASEIDRRTFVDGWFVKTMPDLNQRNDLLATYLTQNSIWWVEYADLAGIRMDTYPYPDMGYMTEWTRRVMEEYPNFNVVGEEWFGNPAILAYWQKGKVNPNGYTSYLKSLMDFPLQEALVEALITEEKQYGSGLVLLYEMLAMDFLYADPDNLVVFPDNHDMDRFFTQIGEDFELFKLGLVHVLTTRGIPQIYYGTEILMASKGDGDHGIVRSDFPGGWAGDPVNAFTGEGLTASQKEATEYIRQLLHWRKNAGVIHHGRLMHFVPDDGVYVYFRYQTDAKVMVILNKMDQEKDLELERFSEMLDGHSRGRDVLSGQAFDLQRSIRVPARSALVLELD